MSADQQQQPNPDASSLAAAAVPDPRRPVAEEIPLTKLFVRGVPDATTKKELLDLFTPFGKVVGIRTGGRGYAFVELEGGGQDNQPYQVLRKLIEAIREIRGSQVRIEIAKDSGHAIHDIRADRIPLSSDAQVICFSCNSVGHFARNCPSNPGGASSIAPRRAIPLAAAVQGGAGMGVGAQNGAGRRRSSRSRSRSSSSSRSRSGSRGHSRRHHRRSSSGGGHKRHHHRHSGRSGGHQSNDASQEYARAAAAGLTGDPTAAAYYAAAYPVGPYDYSYNGVAPAGTAVDPYGQGRATGSLVLAPTSAAPTSGAAGPYGLVPPSAFYGGSQAYLGAQTWRPAPGGGVGSSGTAAGTSIAGRSYYADPSRSSRH